MVDKKLEKKLELLRILAAGCKKHPAYRASDIKLSVVRHVESPVSDCCSSSRKLNHYDLQLPP